MFWALAAGRDRHARVRVRARPAGHPDAERVGARGPARGDRDLAARVPVRPGPLRAAAARREHGLGLRADRRRARAADARAAARRRDRRPGPDDDRVPRAAPRARRVRATARCRSTEILDEVLVGPRRRRARDPRGPAHLRARTACTSARPRRVVAARDRAAAAARRQRRAPRPRRRGCSDLSAVLRDVDPGRARQPRARRSSTRCGSAAGSTPRSPTASSACTSTSSRATTATRAAGGRGAAAPRRGDRRLPRAGPPRLRS